MATRRSTRSTLGWCNCSITGYGQRGPYSAQPGHDVNYLGYTGVLAQTADVNGRPVLPGIQIADLLGGSLTGAMTILAALIGAAKSGTGCHLDVSMTDSVYAHSVMLNAEVSQSGATGSPSNGLLTGGVACYNVYETGDGRYLAVGALEAKFWDSLCDAIDRVDLKPRHWSRGETPGSDAAVDAIAQLAREFKREGSFDVGRATGNARMLRQPRPARRRGRPTSPFHEPRHGRHRAGPCRRRTS